MIFQNISHVLCELTQASQYQDKCFGCGSLEVPGDKHTKFINSISTHTTVMKLFFKVK